jgi:hypothetical protein
MAEGVALECRSMAPAQVTSTDGSMAARLQICTSQIASEGEAAALPSNSTPQAASNRFRR